MMCCCTYEYIASKSLKPDVLKSFCRKSPPKLGRASSLIKKYSQLTEEERKDLIKKAFEMKEKLEKELKDTKAEVEAKVKELKSLQNEVSDYFLQQ